MTHFYQYIDCSPSDSIQEIKQKIKMKKKQIKLPEEKEILQSIQKILTDPVKKKKYDESFNSSLIKFELPSLFNNTYLGADNSNDYYYKEESHFKKEGSKPGKLSISKTVKNGNHKSTKNISYLIDSNGKMTEILPKEGTIITSKNDRNTTKGTNYYNI